MKSATQLATLEAPTRRAALSRALAWLSHPVSIASIAVLVLNDHLLKESFGTWWTGKLSDFAGLVFFPALLALAIAIVAPRARHPRVVFASIIATGVGFAWVKATTAGATTASAVWSEVAGPSVILRDATDLVALPMLGLAAFIAFRAKPRREVFVATFAVPFAVVATVATGAPPDPSATVLAGDPAGWVVVVERGGTYGYSPVYQRQPDGSWVDIATQWEDETLGDQLTTTTLSCVPAEPTQCFRPLAGRIGVEASTNGGVTWHVDWQLSDSQLDTLRDAYDIARNDRTSLTTWGVGVIETPDGYEVLAANGDDGLAKRGVDGTWVRTGWEGFGCCEYVAIAELSDEEPEWRQQEGLAWPVAWALTAFVVGFAVILVASPRTRRRHTGVVVMGSALVFAGLAWASVSLLINGMPSSRVPDGGYVGMLVAGNLLMGFTPAFGGTFMLVRGTGKAFKYALGKAVLVAVWVGVLSALAPDLALVEALVALGAFASVVGSVVWLERSRHREVEAAPPVQA